MSTIEATITINAEKYHAEPATVERANLGYEDHGILAWNIGFLGSSWGQGTGHRGLGNSGYFVSVLKELLRVFKVQDWSDIEGSRVYVLRADKFGPIVGISSLDGDETFMLQAPDVSGV